MLPPHIAALNQLGPASPPSQHPFPSAHTPFVPSRSGGGGAGSFGYPELHAPHSHGQRAHAHGHGHAQAQGSGSCSSGVSGAGGAAEGSSSSVPSPLPLGLDFQQSELDLNAALARQLEEWTNVDFSFDDGPVGMGIGLKSEGQGPAGWSGGGGGSGDQGGDNGNEPGAGGNGQPNGGGDANGPPQEEEEERWDTKKGKGTRVASSRRLHERLEQGGGDGAQPQDQDVQQQQQQQQQQHGPSQANAFAGPSAHGTPFGTPHPLGQAMPPPNAGAFPAQLAAGNGLNLALDPNLMAFLQSMYQSQLASQFGAQAQAWVAQNQQGQAHGHGLQHGQGQGQAQAQGLNVSTQHQGMNGHSQAHAPGSSSAAHTSGVNTPTSAHPGNYNYPAFAIDALTTLSDPGVWGGIMGGNANTNRAPPVPAAPSRPTEASQNARAGPSRAIEPTAPAQPVYDASRSTRVSPRPTSSRKQSSTSAVDVEGDTSAHTPTAPNGSSARGKKRQRSSTLGRNEREESTSDRSGTGDANGQGEADAGGMPAGTPAGNGMVYAPNGEIISHEEDKRRRNTEASARFRMKKKEREQAVERKKQELEDRCARLERENNGLRKENTWLKALLVNGTPQPLNSPSPLEQGDSAASRGGPKGKQ